MVAYRCVMFSHASRCFSLIVGGEAPWPRSSDRGALVESWPRSSDRGALVESCWQLNPRLTTEATMASVSWPRSSDRGALGESWPRSSDRGALGESWPRSSDRGALVESYWQPNPRLTTEATILCRLMVRSDNIPPPTYDLPGGSDCQTICAHESAAVTHVLVWDAWSRFVAFEQGSRGDRGCAGCRDR